MAKATKDVRLKEAGIKVRYEETAEGSGVYIASSAFPENEEVVALASDDDATGGRTSSELTNRYGRALAILLSITEVTDSSFISLDVEAKVGSAWVSIGSYSLNLTETGEHLLLLHPTIADTPLGYTGLVNSVLPRVYRITTTTNANGTSKTLSYSVTCVHLL
jgi:hypothetical protein